MSKVDLLEAKVRALYEEKNPGRDEWADWLYAHHVFVVDSYARQLS